MISILCFALAASCIVGLLLPRKRARRMRVIDVDEIGSVVPPPLCGRRAAPSGRASALHD